MANSDYNSGKASAVKFFMVLSCIASVVGGIASIARGNLTGGIILLVSLVWTIPMTVYAKNRLNAHEYIGTGFKICTLLFHNLIAGIILLCMNTEGEKKETDDNTSNDKSSANNINGASSGRPSSQTPRQNAPTPTANTQSKSSNNDSNATAPTKQNKASVIIFSKALYRRYLIDRGYSVVTPSGNPSTVDDYCHRIDFVCNVENIGWADIPTHIDKLLQEYGRGGIKQSLGAKSNNSVINALRRADECIQKQKRNS